MTTRQFKESANLNTAIGALTVIGMIVTGVWFIAPLRTLPDDMEAVKRTQIIQTEAIKTLADVAADTKQARGEIIRHDAEIREVKRRLDRLESR